MVMGVKSPVDALVVLFPRKTGKRGLGRKSHRAKSLFELEGFEKSRENRENWESYGVMDVKIPLDAFLVLFCLKTGLRRKIHHKSSLFELEVRSVKKKGQTRDVFNCFVS